MSDPTRPNWALRPSRSWLRIVGSALIFSVLVITGVLVRRFRRQEPAPTPPVPLPANVNQRLSGYTFTRSEGRNRIFSIHASHTVAFGKGEATILENVTAELFNKAGNRRDVLRADKCEYRPSTGAFACPGKVTIELDIPPGAQRTPARPAKYGQEEPLYLETSSLAFDPSRSLVATSQSVQLSFGAARAAAVGAVYATRDGWLELKKDVSLEWPLEAASSSSGSASDRNAAGHVPSPPQNPEAGDRLMLKASRARYEKSSGKVKLGGPLEVTETTRRVTAAGGTVFLDGGNRVVSATLEGRVQANDSSPQNPMQAAADYAQGIFDPTSEELQSLLLKGHVTGESRRRASGSNERDQAVIRLAAEQAEVQFQAGGAHSEPHPGSHASPGPLVPAEARATGGVHITLESFPTSTAEEQAMPGPVRRDLTAPEVLFAFRPQPISLRDVRTRGAGSLVLSSADAREPKRTITADQFFMTFDSGSRLEKLQGTGRCHAVFEPPPGSRNAVPQETFSEQLEARVDSATQRLAEAEQSGGFEFRQGDRRAKAGRAHYSASGQELTLTGSPALWDSDTRLRAERVVLHVGTGIAEGLGKVESTYSPTSASGASQQAETINVLADRATADRRLQLAHYEGHVRAWRGFDVLESPWLDLHRAERRIVAGDGVAASFLQPRTESPRRGSRASSGDQPTPAGMQPLIIHAERLNYLDAERHAQLDGGVRADTGDMTLTADHLDAYFSAPAAGSNASMRREDDAPRIERLVARGHVIAAEPSWRATGDRGEYWAAESKVVLTGGPPVLYDARNGFTTGHRLTFLTRDDSLLVDGGDQSPAVSKRRVVR